VVDIEVQIESITSDDSLRDSQFTGRIMNAAEFPTADVQRLTEPIEFGTIPVGDEQVTATATGELTLAASRTRSPSTSRRRPPTAHRRVGIDPGRVRRLRHRQPVVRPGRTEDDGLVEFVLVFERA
jgi:hypothetical protein